MNTQQKIEKPESLQKEIGVVTLKKCSENSTFLHISQDHVSKIMYDRVCHKIAPAELKHSGAFVTGLTEAEERYFESVFGYPKGHLKKYNKEFWGDYTKFVKVPKEGVTLHPDEDDTDLFKYKVLAAQKEVAISERDRTDNYSSIVYLMTSKKDVERAKAKTMNIKMEAMKVLTNMTPEDRRNFLLSLGKSSREVSDDSINVSIMEILENNPDGFLTIANDPHFQTKVFLNRAKEGRVIRVHGTKYFLEGSDEAFAYTIKDAIEYLENPVNQEFKFTIENLLKSRK
jgi:hypothetical protein